MRRGGTRRRSGGREGEVMGRTVKIVHTADLHLGMQPEKDLPIGAQRAQEIADVLPRLIDECNRVSADLLLIAGDLFHRGPLQRELREVTYLFGKLVNTHVVLIAGNHDFISARSNYPAWIAANHWRPEDAAQGSRVTMLADREMSHVTLPGLGTTVYGLSYHTQNVTEPVYDDFTPPGDGIRILLAHGGDANDAPFNLRKLESNGWEYVALGHIHKTGELAPRIAYAGSPEPLDRNETGAHGYRLVTISEAAPGRYETEQEFVPLAVREYRDVTLPVTGTTTQAELRDAVIAAVAKGGAQHMYRIFLEGRRNADMEIDGENLRAAGNITEICDRTLPEYDLEALRAEHADSLIGMYIDALSEQAKTDETAQQALYLGLTALIRR